MGTEERSMIIGIQMDWNSGVAVYADGKILYAANEERFTRRKNDALFPENAISKAIEVCGIVPEKIEQVVLATKNVMPYQFLCDLGSYTVGDWLKEEERYFKPRLLGGVYVDYLDVFRDKAARSPYRDLYELVKDAPEEARSGIFADWRRKKAADAFGVGMDKVSLVNHELSHAAYGLYGADFGHKEDVLAVVYDGWGDTCNASIWVHNGERLQQVQKYTNYNVGRFYRYITLLLAMKPAEHEYKVMGLAPYASPYTYKTALEIFRKAYKFKEGEVIIDPELHDNYYYFKERLEGERFDAIAAGVQIETEEMNCALVQYWMERTGKRKVVLGGGVSMNIKANMEIGKMPVVDDMFVVGSGDDTGLCIGSIYAWLDQNGRSKEICGLDNLYLGDCADDFDEMLRAIDQSRYNIEKEVTPFFIAELLAKGYILGRVSGKMEFGARALGNRSVLADPRDRNMVDRINQKIKNRDFWMPFTPSILEEDAEKYLVNPKQFRFPYMSIGCETTEEAWKSICAALHPADHSARPQLVNRQMNQGYYDLICAFKDITGVGALLNTSLNIHGYPIVRTYMDAYHVLEQTELDGLILGESSLILRK